MFSNHILYFCNQVLELTAGPYMYSSYILSCWIPPIILSCGDNLDPDSLIPTCWPSLQSCVICTVDKQLSLALSKLLIEC